MAEVRHNRPVQIRFLLGPAGSGKTFQCLSEVRTALLKSPEGLPLIFIAPKQATFQIERQLLGDGSLGGYTRLKISSFERLAAFLLDVMGRPAPRLLDDDGRVMVLRALLARHHAKLHIFHASARLPGFAQQLSALLREFQRARISPASLEQTAGELGDASLSQKLADVALLFREYLAWLEREKLEDADHLLDLATHLLEAAAKGDAPRPRFAGLWLDGFAEMTEQELALLRALVPFCDEATLAFCCEASALDEQERFSPWSVVAQTTRRCLNALAGASMTLVELRQGAATRFAGNSELAHLEENWSAPRPFKDAPQTIRIIRCPNIASEAVFAAREICRAVRNGARYRDFAVLVRQLDGYQDVLPRVFSRYEIPFFLDRRQPVSHHPLAELTRYALRTVVRDWKQDDWFGLLKSGLTGVPEIEVDALENEALARGWEGSAWLDPLHVPEDSVIEARLEAARKQAVEPLRAFQSTLASPGYSVTGDELARALRELWRSFQVEEQLETWSLETPEDQVHATVWDQMRQWLDTIALGFAQERVPLREWLPIIEAGLSGLAVGVIPPTTDQVVIGSIDRSRNPDLRGVFLLGVNEGVFPAAPPMPPVLTEGDRLALQEKLPLGANVRQQLAHERFYGYIACTRARENLFVLYADADRRGRKLHPSAFVNHLMRLFPQLVEEKPREPMPLDDAVHLGELIVPLLRARRLGDARAMSLLADDAFVSVRNLPECDESPARRLSSQIIEQLYPSRLVTSVSRLEEFASCAFRFFVTTGLRAKERLRYEADARHTGTFQHEVLKIFHETLTERGQKWRDVSPTAARQLLREIAERELPKFKNGVLLATDRDRVESQNLIASLEDFIETAVAWSRQYQFDPVAVELKFGQGGKLPPWELQLANGKQLAFGGAIDRVDAFVDRERNTAAVVVMDYKSSARAVDVKMLGAGVQMQLFAYLSALRKLPEARGLIGAEVITPAGAFYLSLRGSYESAASRDEALESLEATRREAFKHRGRFASELLVHFDSDNQARRVGDQFGYRLTNSGSIHGNCADPISTGELTTILDDVERQLVAMGDAIFAGDVSLNPYRHGADTPCDRCDFESICRIDRTTHEFRALTSREAHP